MLHLERVRHLYLQCNKVQMDCYRTSFHDAVKMPGGTWGQWKEYTLHTEETKPVCQVLQYYCNYQRFRTAQSMLERLSNLSCETLPVTAETGTVNIKQPHSFNGLAFHVFICFLLMFLWNIWKKDLRGFSFFNYWIIFKMFLHTESGLHCFRTITSLFTKCETLAWAVKRVKISK